MNCNRCKKQITDYELCWYCFKPLCFNCWDEYGHCGHKEADEINKKAKEHHSKTLNN